MPAEGSLGGLAQRRSRMTDPLNRPPPRLGTRSMKAGKTLGFCSPPRVGCGSPGTLPPGSIGVSTDRRAHFRDGFLRQREQSSLQRRFLRGAARNKPWFCGGLECRATSLVTTRVRRRQSCSWRTTRWSGWTWRSTCENAAIGSMEQPTPRSDGGPASEIRHRPGLYRHQSWSRDDRRRARALDPGKPARGESYRNNGRGDRPGTACRGWRSAPQTVHGKGPSGPNQRSASK